MMAGVNHAALREIVAGLPDDLGWVRALLERCDSGWTWRFGHVTVGVPPEPWSAETWRYESVALVAATVSVKTLGEHLLHSAGAAECLRVGEFDVAIPAVQQTVHNVQHRPSFELHDRLHSEYPSLEYSISRDGGDIATTSTAGRADFLVGPDSPSFTDLDSAYRAFFLHAYDFPDNASVPTNLMNVRVIDTRGRIGPIDIQPTHMAIDVRGDNLAESTLEYSSPTHRQRFAVDSPAIVTVDLPEGLPATNTRLWLTRGTEWLDYRALTPPWASAQYLDAAGVKRETGSRDEQAAAAALVHGGEGPYVEFKSVLPDGKPKAKTDRVFMTIAAFANGGGGTVVFGIDRDELSIIGIGDDVDPLAARDRIGQIIRARVRPTPDFEITSRTVNDKQLLFVEVQPGASPPYGVIIDLDRRDSPQFYVRRGASTYPAQPSDLHELFRRVTPPSSPGSWGL